MNLRLPIVLCLSFYWISCGLWAQEQAYLDVKRIKAEVLPFAQLTSNNINMEVSFKVTQAIDSVYLDAIGFKLDGIPKLTIDSIKTKPEKIVLYHSFAPDSLYTVGFAVKNQPKQTLYFTGEQIWTQGQGKYTSHWLPSLDNMNDKIEFDLSIWARPEKTVLANGRLVKKSQKDGFVLWRFDMQKPMSSYLVAFAIGDFVKETTTSSSGVPMEFYLSKEDSAKMEPTYRHSKQIFDFFEQTIGVAYPWQNYKQVPVRDFLYAGMENTTATIFSEAFVCDATGFNDRNYVNVNAHELAHQWFGNLVTEVGAKDHWLHEGFASYYALLAEQEIFGDDYYYWKLYQSAERLKEQSEAGKGQSLLDPKASSLTFYEKGTWALHVLKAELGTLNFNLAVQSFLEQYAFKNVTVDNFLQTVEQVTGKSMEAFKKDWLQQTTFNSSAALEALKKSTLMQAYFQLQAKSAAPLESKASQFKKLLSSSNDYLGQEVVYQLSDTPLSTSLPLYQHAFESNNLFIRQAIAESLTQVPEPLRSDYESLLEDASYVTQEMALYNLWNSFPTRQHIYLDRTNDFIGFNNKNLRQLWLVLALVTQTYRPENKLEYLNELIDYASADYSFETREIALRYLNDLGVSTDPVLKSVLNACVHHNWRFRNFGRTLFKGIIQDPTMEDRFRSLSDQINQKEREYMLSKFKK